MIVILGATGNTGGAAAQALLAGGHPVRAVGRSEAKLKPLAAAGAEIASADLERAGELTSVLEGAQALYALIPPNPSVDDFRAYQERVSSTVADAVRQSDTQHVVVLSSLGANHPDGTGPVVGLHEFEEKLRLIDGVNVLTLRAAYFMENLFMNVARVRTSGELVSPAPGDVPLPLIHSADIGRYAARRLAAMDFSGCSVVNLVGPRPVTMNEVADVLGRAMARSDVRYRHISYEEAERGMIEMGLRPSLAGLYSELYRAAARGLLEPEPGTQTVSTETSIEAFAPIFAHRVASST